MMMMRTSKKKVRILKTITCVRALVYLKYLILQRYCVNEKERDNTKIMTGSVIMA